MASRDQAGASSASQGEKESLAAREAELAVPCQEPERSALVDGEGHSAAQGRFELHIVLPVASRDDAMGLARKAFDAVSPYAQSVTVHEETTMPILKQVGSIGVSRG